MLAASGGGKIARSAPPKRADNIANTLLGAVAIHQIISF